MKREQLIDFLVMFDLSLSQGLPIETAIEKVSEFSQPPLKDELSVFLETVKSGGSVKEALADLAMQIPNPFFHRFIRYAIFCHQSGLPMKAPVEGLLQELRNWPSDKELPFEQLVTPLLIKPGSEISAAPILRSEAVAPAIMPAAPKEEAPILNDEESVQFAIEYFSKKEPAWDFVTLCKKAGVATLIIGNSGAEREMIQKFFMEKGTTDRLPYKFVDLDQPNLIDHLITLRAGSEPVVSVLRGEDLSSAIENLVAGAKADGLSEDLALRTLSSVFQLSLSISSLSDGRKYLNDVTEIVGMVGSQVARNEIFKFHASGMNKNRQTTGRLKATGLVPSFIDRLANSEVPNPRSLFEI